MAHAADDAGLEVRDRLVVRDGGWSSLQCTTLPAVRPGGGPCHSRTRCLPSPSSSAARSAPWRTGRRSRTACVRPSRRPRTPSTPAPTSGWRPDERPYEDTAAAFHDLRRRELQTWATVLRCGDEDGPMPELTPPELARLAVSPDRRRHPRRAGGVDLPRRPHPRPGSGDAAGADGRRPPRTAAARRRTWGSTRPSTPPTAQRLERRLVAVCAALARGLEHVPPLTVLASFTWWRGDGALTRIALDRALAVDPDYRLARLLAADGGPGHPAVRGARLRPAVRRVDTPPRGHRTVYTARQVMSSSIEPRLAGRQPSSAVGCPG